MGVFEHFPYVNFHELNLDWLICEVKKVSDQVKELNLDFNELKAYVDNYFSELNVSDELRDIIQEMIDDGTLAQIVQSYINTDYVTPDQFKTSNNTWDQAFDQAALSDKPVLIPNKNYTLARPHYFSKDNIIANLGNYTNYGIVTTGTLEELKNPYAWRMMKQPSFVDGFNTSNGSQSWGYNEDKDCWIFADIHNNNKTHLVEFKKDFSEPLNDWEVGDYPDIHGGSVTYCHEKGFYIIAGSQTNQVWKVDVNSGAVQTIVLSSPSNMYITFFEYDKVNKVFYAVDQIRKLVHIYDVDFTYLESKAFDTDLNFLPSGATWQQIITVNGCLYGLFSIDRTGDTWGYAIGSIDLQHGNMKTVYSKYYDYPGFVLETEGIAYDGENLIVIGCNGPVDFIDTWGTYTNYLETSNGDYYIDESSTTNGDGAQATPFNLLNTAIYAAYKNNQRAKIIINHCTRDITLTKIDNDILELHDYAGVINIDRCVNLALTGDSSTLGVVASGSIVQITGLTANVNSANGIYLTNGTFGIIRNSTINGGDPPIAILQGSFATFYNVHTSNNRLAVSSQGGSIINAGSNSSGTSTVFYGDKVI